MENKPTINRPILPGEKKNEINRPILPGEKKNDNKFSMHDKKQPNNVSADNFVINTIHINDNYVRKEENPASAVVVKSGKFLIRLIIIILLLALITSLIIIFVPRPESPAEICINFDVEGTIDFEEELAPGQNHYIMPGDSYNSRFSIKSTASAEDEGGPVYVRARVYAIVEGADYCGNMVKISSLNQQDWFEGADGYIYLKQTLGVNSQVDITNKILFEESITNQYQGKSIEIHFEAQAVQAGGLSYAALEQYFPTAPTEWKMLFYNNRGVM